MYYNRIKMHLIRLFFFFFVIPLFVWANINQEMVFVCRPSVESMWFKSKENISTWFGIDTTSIVGFVHTRLTSSLVDHNFYCKHHANRFSRLGNWSNTHRKHIFITIFNWLKCLCVAMKKRYVYFCIHTTIQSSKLRHFPLGGMDSIAFWLDATIHLPEL